MSTKCSVAWGDGFHLYQECLEDDGIYLEIDKCEVQFNGGVTIKIPSAVWETIRHYGAVDLSLADMTDAQLRRLISKDVSERIAQVREARKELKDDPEKLASKLAVLDLFGCMLYGAATDPKKKQVDSAMIRYRNLRDAQTATKAQVAKWRKDIIPGPFVIELGRQKEGKK